MTRRLGTCAFIVSALSLVGSAQDSRFHGSEFTGVPMEIAVDKLPEFAVADIQVTKNKGAGPRAQFLPGGRVQFQSLPMKFIILAAWGWENDENRVTGGPAWINSEQFDIVAKAPPDAQIVDLRLMLRSLLIKRFGLEAHIREDMLPVYALEKGKAAPKVTPSEKQAALDCSRSQDNGNIVMTCHNMTMDELATSLRAWAPAYVDRPVVNLTGLTGQFDFKVGWTPRGRLLGGDGRGGAADSAPKSDTPIPTSSDPGGGITVFEGVDKYLALKMTPTKHAAPLLVVDKINRTPIEN